MYAYLYNYLKKYKKQICIKNEKLIYALKINIKNIIKIDKLF